MSDKSAEFDAGELLRAIGEVRMPAPRVLEDARAVLWSAVASETLGMGRPAGREEQHRATRRRQTDRSQDGRKMSMGGGDPGSGQYP
jgi:hypothetical protein